MTAKLFRLAAREQLLGIPEEGVRANDLGNAPRRFFLRSGFADLVDDDRGGRLVLTETGKAVQELARDWKAALDAAQRLVEDGLAAALSKAGVRLDVGRADEPGKRVLRAPAQMTCGTGNHDSFADFLASLEAAGKNRWKDPKYMGEGPVRVRNQPAREEE